MPARPFGTRSRAGEEPERVIPPGGYTCGDVPNGENVRGDAGGGGQEVVADWGWGGKQGGVSQGDVGVQVVRSAREEALEVNWVGAGKWLLRLVVVLAADSSLGYFLF